MSESTAVTGFNEAPLPTAIDAGTSLAIAQSGDELKAAVVTAHHFPRDEAAAVTRILRSCERPAFAEGAAYRFERGGKPITGPSVQLAREEARCWGNMRSGLRIIAVTTEEVHIEGWAYDTEANNFASMQDYFAKKIQRKVQGKTIWVEPDERDLRELINRRGAICERNAILKLLPPDVTEMALAKARNTLERAAKGELEQNRDDAIRRLAYAFDKLGVTTTQLEAYLTHPLAQITMEEVAELREVYRSIEDGNSTRDEYFGTRNVATTAPLQSKIKPEGE